MDVYLIIALAAVAVAGAALFFAARRGRGSDPELVRLSQSQSELVGSLKTLVDQSAAAQSATAERLQAQERALAKALEERFADITKRVGDSIEKTAQQTSTTIGDLRERLVKIDEAQKSLVELSTHVVSLQDILSNKQARGAFGEEQLEAIVRDQLPPAHFEFQATLSNQKRVDCVLRLPRRWARLRSTPSSRARPMTRCARPAPTRRRASRRSAPSPPRSTPTSATSPTSTSSQARPPRRR